MADGTEPKAEVPDEPTEPTGRDETGAGAPGEAPASGALIEIGWVLVGPFEPHAEAAVERGRERAAAWFAERFPRFTWRTPVERRPHLDADLAEPAVLLSVGANELERAHWDFAVVVTAADLKAYEKDASLGAPSKAIGVAVLSTARLAPRPPEIDGGAEGAAGERDAARVAAAAIHLVADLIGALHTDDPAAFTTPPARIEDLDRMEGVGDAQHERMRRALERVADARLEERPEGKRRGRLAFTARVVWHEADAIVRAVWEAKPWRFSLELSRMTTAAASALLIVLLTAEAWELGTSQSLGTSLLLGSGAVFGTGAFLLRRGKLVLGPRRSRRTEQAIIARVSVQAVVVLALVFTYLFLLSGALLLAWIFYPRSLVEGWASSIDGPLRWTHYLALANFAASMGVIIAALGASFEAHDAIRHATYVDEEL